MNWLAHLEVDAEAAGAHGIFDNYSWHKRIWEDCFQREPDAKRDFLTRIDHLEKTYRVWILAKRKPVRPPWCSSIDFAIKEISPSFLSHRYYAFDLRANPTKCVDQRGPDGNKILRSDGKRTKGKRVPLVKREELRVWLLRKAEIRCHDERAGVDIPSGFRIVEEQPLEISPMLENHFRRKDDAAYHGAVQFRGILEVTDREKFMESYQSGIGSAKGFGFGLLLLAPIQFDEQKSNTEGGKQ
ncbi:MAG TPA: type I-E CRISPR-associated protein Cas6/Cse3/CasE [Candidatus Kryptonia bacterium]